MRAIGASDMTESRLRKVKSLMKRKGLDCILITPGPNLRYLTGFHYDYPGDPWDAMVTWDMTVVGVFQVDGEPIFIAPKTSENWMRWIPKTVEVRTYSGAKDRAKVLKNSLREMKGTLGVEDHLQFKTYEQLASAAPHLKVSNASEMLCEARVVKTEEEIALIRKAAAIVEAGVKAGREFIRVSATEKEISLEVEHAMRRKGVESISYCVVQRGPKTATWDPPSEDRVNKGDLFLMDLSATFSGYHADITRMTVVGKPSEKQTRVYGVVEKAQSRAISAIRPGIKAGRINDAARKVMEEEGYIDRFPFGIGHGLGLEAHEIPHLTEYWNTEMMLQPGVVMTVEPTINIPGEFGIRIEDDVLVTARGRKMLTTLERELVQV